MIIDWNLTWNMIASIGTVAGVIFTAILTFIIIRQTKKLNKEQLTLDRKINEQQIALQKRQLKIDVFPYKREIYINLLKVLEFAHFMDELLKKLNLNEYSMRKLYEMYSSCINNYIGDVSKTNYCLREAGYIFPQNISTIINQVYRNFDSICASFISCNALHDILKESGLEEETKNHIIKNIQNSLSTINNYADLISETVPNEIYIASLDR